MMTPQEIDMQEIKLHFNLNITRRLEPKKVPEIKFNIPSTPAVQIAVHSPYSMPSPFRVGTAVLGGKAYDMYIKQEEKHLLSAPYQTNCTDYMTNWKKKGGIAPTDQTSLLQECKMQKAYKERGCVPLNIDYPHQYPSCQKCEKVKDCKGKGFSDDHCEDEAEKYNQPCDSSRFEVEINEVVITVPKVLKSMFSVTEERVNTKIRGHDCSERKMLEPECSIIDIDILLDRFEITNLTYFPKYESLELFSVVGGYMGMWLGVSLVAVYDFLGSVFSFLQSAISNRKLKMKSHGRHVKKHRKRDRPDANERKRKSWISANDDHRYRDSPRYFTRTRHY